MIDAHQVEEFGLELMSLRDCTLATLLLSSQERKGVVNFPWHVGLF